MKGFGLNLTVFGMTFVWVAIALEEVRSVVAPFREGRSSIAVDDIVRGLIFLAIGNIDLFAVTRVFTLNPRVLMFC